MPWASWNPSVDPVASCPRRSTWKPSEFWRLSPSFPATALGRPSSPWEFARPQRDTKKNTRGILEILETHWYFAYFAFFAIENHLICLDLCSQWKVHLEDDWSHFEFQEMMSWSGPPCEHLCLQWRLKSLSSRRNKTRAGDTWIRCLIFLPLDAWHTGSSNWL